MNNSLEEKSEIILLKNKDRSFIDGEFCRLIRFTPLVGYVENGVVKAVDSRTPYGSVHIECKKIPGKITGFITNKVDFLNLWKALKERDLKSNEEVIIIWSRKNYKHKLLKLRCISAFMPKLRVVICPKGLYESITRKSLDPELASFIIDEDKIAEWKFEATSSLTDLKASGE